ncbi:hypothetical protein [Pedobacter borealis]|uniref:hypothetical protein n=1 Tax=Pedobacter borealis TaxID=475254 RepID=UPI0004938883|nr:hypothetical protein [Pedobacter borealis]
MEDIGNSYTAYSLGNLEKLVIEAERLNSSNLLEAILKDDGFTKQGDNRYSGKDPDQIIELTPGENGLSYVNKLQEADRGQLIQFLQNRMISEQYIIPNTDLISSYPLYRSPYNLKKRTKENR